MAIGQSEIDNRLHQWIYVRFKLDVFRSMEETMGMEKIEKFINSNS
jgi:hypothetical protein